MMCARDFQGLALALNRSNADASTIREIVKACHASNPRFDLVKFLQVANALDKLVPYSIDKIEHQPGQGGYGVFQIDRPLPIFRGTWKECYAKAQHLDYIARNHA